MPRAGEARGSSAPAGAEAAGPSLGQVGEGGVLAEVFGALRDQPVEGVLVGPGDDTALLGVRRGAVLATTDTMVRGEDWLDEWSTAADVGFKAVTQNLADLAAMGGVGTGLLLTLIAERSLPVAWARGLTDGIARGAARAGVPVLGGDLSAAPRGTVAVSVTALGELGEGVQRPVLRSGARAGDVLAVSGPLGRSGAGLEQLRAGVRDGALVEHHLRPVTDLSQGPVAARAGATAMIDVSDGLLRDADRVARASGVVLELDEESVGGLVGRLTPYLVLGHRERASDVALTAVLRGGEEHELLATFPPGTVPEGWVELGRAVRVDEPGDGSGGGPGVCWRGELVDPRQGGWDHFGG